MAHEVGLFPAMLEPWVHSRWDLLKYLKFLELRQRRREEAQAETDTINQQHAEAVAALRR